MPSKTPLETLWCCGNMTQQGLKRNSFCLAMIVYPKYMVCVVLYQRIPNWVRRKSRTSGVCENLSCANHVRFPPQRDISRKKCHPFDTLEFTEKDNGIFRDLSKSGIIVRHSTRVWCAGHANPFFSKRMNDSALLYWMINRSALASKVIPLELR